jgi:hypothetical protein
VPDSDPSSTSENGRASELGGKVKEADAQDTQEAVVGGEFNFFIAAPTNVTSGVKFESSQFRLEERSDIESKTMVQLDKGSQIEQIVKNYGLAALSYHQALDIVYKANGLTRTTDFANVHHNEELDDPPLASELEAKAEETERAENLPRLPSFGVRYASYIWEMLSSAFLPTGYPYTVSSDYAKYYRYMFVQNVAGSFSYMMSMTALLQAVGISSGALGAAAAVSWVMKDGLGAVGMIFAAKVLGDANTFDANTIRSKFRADILHNFGVALELMTMMFPASFLLLASAANTVKGVAGLVNGACKASINQHMAIVNNLGDLTAKGHVQGLAAYLTGLALGIGYDRLAPSLVNWLGPSTDNFLRNVLSTLGLETAGEESASLVVDAASVAETAVSNASETALAVASTTTLPLSATALLWLCFSLSTLVHLSCSYRALRSLALPSLNPSRTHLLIQKYLEANPVVESSSRQQIIERDDLVPSTLYAFRLPETHVRPPLPTPFELSREASERIILPEMLESAPRIILGASVSRAFQSSPHTLQPLIAKSINSPYLIHGDKSGTKIWVVLSSEATSKQLLKSFFHACTARSIMLAEEITGSLWEDAAKFDMIKGYVDKEYPFFEAQLISSGWRLDQILLTPKPSRADWTLASPPDKL